MPRTDDPCIIVYAHAVEGGVVPSEKLSETSPSSVMSPSMPAAVRSSGDTRSHAVTPDATSEPAVVVVSSNVEVVGSTGPAAIESGAAVLVVVVAAPLPPDAPHADSSSDTPTTPTHACMGGP